MGLLRMRVVFEDDDDGLNRVSARLRRGATTEAERTALLGLSCNEMKDSFGVPYGSPWGLIPDGFVRDFTWIPMGIPLVFLEY